MISFTGLKWLRLEVAHGLVPREQPEEWAFTYVHPTENINSGPAEPFVTGLKGYHKRLAQEQNPGFRSFLAFAERADPEITDATRRQIESFLDQIKAAYPMCRLMERNEPMHRYIEARAHQSAPWDLTIFDIAIIQVAMYGRG